jgi:beta-glucanase (GH16 family)
MTPMRTPLRRISRTLAVALLIATPGIAATTHPTSATIGTPVLAASSSPGTCGGGHIAKPSGGYWTCSFDDEFGKRTLDSTKWTVMTTAATGYYTGNACYIDSPNNLAESTGYLRISATRPAAPVACGTRMADYLTTAVITKGKFAQQYGRFEMRAKFPPGVGLQPAFWMYPENLMATGTLNWGEMDIVEAYGAYPGYVQPRVHWMLADGNSTAPGGNCYIPTDTTSYHTYEMEWTSTTITFNYDGVTCWSIPKPESGAPTYSPAPFDQKYFMIVELAIGGTSANLPNATTPFPATMTVDYVRAWS